MISKELLSEVMPEWMAIESSGKYTDEYGFDAIEFTLSFNDALGGKSLSYGKINIHELAHKCKEWANIQNGKYWWVKSHIVTDMRSEATVETYGSVNKKTFEAPTEPEAVFNACQWILDNK